MISVYFLNLGTILNMWELEVIIFKRQIECKKEKYHDKVTKIEHDSFIPVLCQT